MEFVPDTINNARNIAFLNKTKNQAKKLFKLAKQNQLKIDIQNLSHAQEILAQINGFPDWHALEKTINNTVLDNHYHSLSIVNSDEKITNHQFNIKQLELHDGVPVLKDSYSVISLISLNYVSSDYYNFITFMNDIIQATSFQFNMEFHKVSILIEQTEKKQEPLNLPEARYFPINNHDKLGLNLEQFKELFNVSYVLHNTNKSNFSISANIMITTDLSMIAEHVKFCNIFTCDKFKEFFSLQEFVRYDNNSKCYEIKKFNENDGRILTMPPTRIKDSTIVDSNTTISGKHRFPLNEFLTPNNNIDKISSIQFNHNKWIFALYLLSQRQHQWKIKINLLDLSATEINYFTLSHSENNTNDISNINNKYL